MLAVQLILSILFVSGSAVYGLLPFYRFPIKGQLICAPGASLRLAVNAKVEVWEADMSRSCR